MNSTKATRRAVRLGLLFTAPLAFAACAGEIGAGDPEAWPSGGAGEGDVAASEQAVIYGTDSRIEYGQASDQFRRWADAVAILGDPEEIENASHTPCTATDASCTLLTRTFNTTSDGLTLCSNSSGRPAKHYNAQASRGGSCTGFLVAPDIVATAAHCLDDNEDHTLTTLEKDNYCAATAAVFGFQQSSPTSAPTTNFPGSAVYHCQEVLGTQLGFTDRLLPDWALLRLDRPVQGAIPLFVRYTGMVTFAEDLVVIGHPNSLSKKVDPGGAVQWNTPSEIFFEANVDAYGGNSGSPVINELTGVVEGILSDGNTDYVFYSPGQCYTDNVCSELGCSNNHWEHISRITQTGTAIPLHPALTVAVL